MSLMAHNRWRNQVSEKLLLQNWVHGWIQTQTHILCESRAQTQLSSILRLCGRGTGTKYRPYPKEFSLVIEIRFIIHIKHTTKMKLFNIDNLQIDAPGNSKGDKSVYE